MNRLVVDLTPEEHQALKARALMSQKTLKEYAKAYLFQLPNATTLQALEDLETQTNLSEFNSVEDLFVAA